MVVPPPGGWRSPCRRVDGRQRVAVRDVRAVAHRRVRRRRTVLAATTFALGVELSASGLSMTRTDRWGKERAIGAVP